jgi:hypothetical protein
VKRFIRRSRSRVDRADRFLAGDRAPRGQQLLHITVAEGEAEKRPRRHNR